MAELVKRNRKKPVVIQRGTRVSVERTHFDRADWKYSVALPADIERIHGTVQFSFAGSQTLRVLWDIDSSTSSVSREDAVIESDDLSFQTLPSSSKSSDEPVSFLGHDQQPPVNQGDCEANPTQLSDDDSSGRCESENEIDLVIVREKSVSTAKRGKQPAEIKIPAKKARSKPAPPVGSSSSETESNIVVVPEESASTAKRGKQPVKIKIPAKKARSKPTPPAGSSSSESESDTDVDEPEDTVQSFSFKKGGVLIDPRTLAGVTQSVGPRLNLPAAADSAVLDHFFLFLPIEFIRTNIIPTLNSNGATVFGDGWEDVTFDELMIYFALIYAMQIVQLPERGMYWSVTSEEPFPAFNFGKYLPYRRFNHITHSMDSAFEDPLQKKQHVLNRTVELIGECNKSFQRAITPGTFLTLDESMIKAYHQGLPAKIKIPRKPRPVGNEIKNLCDSETKIVLNMELNEGKVAMKEKEFTSSLGHTAATSLRLTKPYWGKAKVALGDSWFGSVKTCKELLERGVFSVLLVKTAHKNYPKLLLHERDLARGEWESAILANSENKAKLFACLFKDKKEFQFIASASTTIEGSPRITKSKKVISRPQVAEQYFKYAGAIDQFNHCRTGSCGLEDVFTTNDPFVCQLIGIFGFVETNSFLSYDKFTRSISHLHFRKRLVFELLQFAQGQGRQLRTRAPIGVSLTHQLAGFEKRVQKRCFFCYHGRPQSDVVKTHWYCTICGEDFPLCCPSTGRNCFVEHLKGLPRKRMNKRKSV